MITLNNKFGPQKTNELHNALVWLYNNEASIKRIIEEAGIKSERISLSQAPINVWHDVLIEAEKEGKTEKINEIASREYPDNEILRQAIEIYRKFTKVKEDQLINSTESTPYRAREKKPRSKSDKKPIQQTSSSGSQSPPSLRSSEPPKEDQPKKTTLFMVGYILEIMLILVIIFCFENLIGCWYRQLPDKFRLIVVNIPLDVIGGTTVLCGVLAAAFIGKGLDSVNRNNSLIKVFRVWMAVVIPCIIFLTYFFLIASEKDSSLTRPNCPISLVIPTLSPTQTYTPSLSPTQTYTPSPSPTQTYTPSPSPTPYNPVCINAQLDAVELIILGSQQIKALNSKNHVTLTTAETYGLKDLKGRARFTNSSVVANCTCSWRGETTDDRDFKDISTSSNDCSFSLPLPGPVKNVYLILKVDGGHDIPVVIDFP